MHSQLPVVLRNLSHEDSSPSQNESPSSSTARASKLRNAPATAASPFFDFFPRSAMHLIDRIVSRSPLGVRRMLRLHQRRVAAGVVAAALLLLFVFFDLLYDGLLAFHARPSNAASAAVWGVEEFDAPKGARAVLVQHSDAVARLNMELKEKCAFQSMFCNIIRLSPQLLPSWTLHTIPPGCRSCTDAAEYGKAVKGVEVLADHAVFATSSAPLGRIGPMLYAMSSVTDDVDVAAELPRWSWLRHVYAGFARSAEKTPRPDVAPYLAVLGIPSTDQPARVALRTAQRRTWLSYSEVARGETEFEGALLPLYLFAAVEPTAASLTGDEGADADGGDREEVEAARGRKRSPRGPGKRANGEAETEAVVVAEVDPYRYVNASSIAPTYSEFKAASQARAAVTDIEANVHYTQRRVQLLERWRDSAGHASPCGQIATKTVSEKTEPSSLSALTSVLNMAVTPAFVSGAQFICHASAALWQEALTHRNVLWVDMMTDRKPTTKKKLGEDRKWGLAVEVGMSQKLILWLHYAYHAFPDVPYIMKGDDDSYLKVPQFLRDLRYIMVDANAIPRSTSEATYLRLPLRDGKKLRSTEAERKNASRALFTAAAAIPAADAPCLYWGSLRVYHGVRFAAGMTFMVHRHMAHAVLSPSSRRRKVDVVKLATHTYNSKNVKAYRRSMFHQEDVLLGLLVNESMQKSLQSCEGGRVFFMHEGLPRFHDMYVGKINDVTWSTVVAHRCRTFDYHYLHYFFQKEHQFSAATPPRTMTNEEYALKTVNDWVMEQREAMKPVVVDWDMLPDVQWTHKAKEAPHYYVDDVDKVAVYESTMHRFQHLRSRVSFGYYADPPA